MRADASMRFLHQEESAMLKESTANYMAKCLADGDEEYSDGHCVVQGESQRKLPGRCSQSLGVMPDVHAQNRGRSAELDSMPSVRVRFPFWNGLAGSWFRHGDCKRYIQQWGMIKVPMGET
jgi:hypothetical protein